MTTTTAADITFLTVPNLVTCSEVTIQWTYNGTTPPTSNYSLVVTNIGINQNGLNSREYPLVPRQRTAVVNTTLAAVNVSAAKFDWVKVNIPQGWYRMNIYAPTVVVPSNIFNVTNGLDVSCVATTSQSLISSSSTSPTHPASSYSTPYTTSQTATTSIPTSGVAAGISSARKRAIAGGVVGGTAVLALIAVIALWLSRRRKARTRNATPPTACLKTKGQPPKGGHSSSDSTGAILQYGGNKESSRQLSTSSEDFTSEKSAVPDDDTMPKPPSIAATRSHSTQASSKRPTSMAVQPSFESYESAQSRSPTSPSNYRYPPDRSRRASRKPVPTYDPSEFPVSEADDIPLSDPPETMFGGGTNIYYIIPDAPLEQRN